jgi:hypothetical protein
MKARKLIEGATAFDAEMLRTVGQAFDEAWSEIEPSIEKIESAIEDARIRLANIVLGLAAPGSNDPAVLKGEALRIFRSLD